MTRILSYLHERKKTTMFLIVLYTAFNIVGHELAQEPFFYVVREFGRDAMQWTLNIFFFLLVLIGVSLVIKKLKQHPQRRRLALYWTGTLFLSILAYLFIMPYKSEGAHFIQYGIMGILVYTVFRKFVEALIAGSLTGILDEHFQYFVTKKIYLDFNDMLLNFLAVALALLLCHTISKSQFFGEVESRIPGIVLWAWGLFLLLGLLLGFVVYFGDQDGYITLMIQNEATFQRKFWYEVPWGIWHQVRPVVGILLLLSLPLFYIPLNALSDDVNHEVEK